MKPRGKASDVSAGFRAARPDDRRWRATQTALGLLLLVAVALAASVLAVQTIKDVLNSGNDELQRYADKLLTVKVTSEAGQFTAVFPAVPKHESSHPPGAPTGNAERLVVSVGDTDLSVKWYDLGSPPSDPVAVLSLLSSAIAREESASISDQGILRSGVEPHHDFTLLTADKQEILVRQMLVGSRVYEVAVAAKAAETVQQDAFNRLADSIEATGSSTTSA